MKAGVASMSANREGNLHGKEMLVAANRDRKKAGKCVEAGVVPVSGISGKWLQHLRVLLSYLTMPVCTYPV